MGMTDPDDINTGILTKYNQFLTKFINYIHYCKAQYDRTYPEPSSTNHLGGFQEKACDGSGSGGTDGSFGGNGASRFQGSGRFRAGRSGLWRSDSAAKQRLFIW